MHVGLNLVFLVPGETGGMEVYARELVPRLVAERPDVRFTAFINREAAAASESAPWGDLVPVVTVPVRARRRVEWVGGEQVLLPGLAERAGVDVLHSLASTAPLRGRFRRVVTVHDLIYRLYPEAHFGLKSLGMRALVPLGVRRAHRVIADSRSTRNDLVRLIAVPEWKVDVVPLGVSDAPRPTKVTEDELRRRHGLGRRLVVLAVSAKRPHKNLPRLLEALALIPTERRPVLILPGYPTPHEEDLRRLARQLELNDDVRFLAWISGEELEGLYAVATCFVLPSLYEGFGLATLEAMLRGVPVASSDRSSMPEVAGDAALYFDPLDPAGIAAAIERLLDDRELGNRLVTAGRRRVEGFSWARTAAGTVASYERALTEGR